MGYKNILAIIGILIVGAGLVMAISNATTSVVSQTRWGGNTSAGSAATQAGNITAVNVVAYSLTNKWASFYGNLSGALVLGDGTGNVYSWTWTNSTGGKICVSTGNNFNFTAAHNMTNGTPIDTAWGFSTTAADSGNATYSPTGGTVNQCNLSLAQANILYTANTTLQGSSTFGNCLIGANSSAITAGQTALLAFCTSVQSAASGRNFKNQPVNYEIMVAANSTPLATETYYFYAELG